MQISDPASGGSKGYTVDESGIYVFNNIPYSDYNVVVIQKPTNDPNPPFDKRIPKKFRQPETSGLKVTLKEGEPVVFDIDME